MNTSALAASVCWFLMSFTMGWAAAVVWSRRTADRAAAALLWLCGVGMAAFGVYLIHVGLSGTP